MLAEPKPTTFQHYLVQNKDKGHDPDQKVKLAHYGAPTNQTEVRGYKLYWIKGKSPDIRATEKEKEHESQLTRIVPLNPGVRFRFKIRFESLHSAELGALLWALTLPGDAAVDFCHRLGMGKPLGMGAVSFKDLRLNLTRREARYERLFDNDRWHTAAEPDQPDQHMAAFEKHILKALGYTDNQLSQVRLADMKRIQMLLAMLQWREGDEAWLEKTRYMAIEPDNEYTERPVLPDPLIVAGVQINQLPAPQGSPAPSKLEAVAKQAAKVADASAQPKRAKLTPPPATQPPPLVEPQSVPSQSRPSGPVTPEPEFVGKPLSEEEIDRHFALIERANREREEKERLRKARKAEKKNRKKKKK